MVLRHNYLRKRAAFTLMEIIVVVAIILILAGAGALVLPTFLADANVKKAKTDVLTLEKAATTYYTNSGGVYPQNLQILAEVDPQTGRAALIKETMLVDPWGQPYQIDVGTLHPKTRIPLIYSPGPPGHNQPIRNWD
jgi:general secretion pathway protein G